MYIVRILSDELHWTLFKLGSELWHSVRTPGLPNTSIARYDRAKSDGGIRRERAQKRGGFVVARS